MTITAIATVAIAHYARKSHELASKIQLRDDEFREQITDLYQAIVIANIVKPGSQDRLKMIKYFKEHYKGKTPIFE